MQSSSNERFEPEQELYIRRWAARFNLAPDDRVVIMTATIERLSDQLSQQFDDLHGTFDERQEQWMNQFSTTQQTLQETLRWVRQQQNRHDKLTDKMTEFTAALWGFQGTIAAFNNLAPESVQRSQEMMTTLSAIVVSLALMTAILMEIQQNQQTLLNERSTLKLPPFFRFAILGLVSLVIAQFVSNFSGHSSIEQQLKAIQDSVNANRLERLEKRNP